MHIHDLHIYAGENQKNQDELRKPSRIQHIFNQIPQALVLVRVLPIDSVVEGRRDDTASHHSNTGRESDPKGRHKKDFRSADIDCVVYVVV